MLAEMNHEFVEKVRRIDLVYDRNEKTKKKQNENIKFLENKIK